MKFFLGEKLTLDEMQVKASDAVAEMETQFTRLMGHVPHTNEIAYVCMNKKCGWWDDSIEDLAVIERVYTAERKREILLPLETPRYEIQIVCPKCHFPTQGISRDIYIQQESAKGYGTITMALKNKRSPLIVSP